MYFIWLTCCDNFTTWEIAKQLGGDYVFAVAAPSAGGNPFKKCWGLLAEASALRNGVQRGFV